MKTLRRVAMLLGLALSGWSGSPACAQDYPAKPIRFLVPFPAGGGADLMARLVAPVLSDRLGQPVIVENRGGAGGTIGAALVARAEPDGYTIMLATANLAWSGSIYDSLSFDPLKDFAAVTVLAKSPEMLAVNPALPVRSVGELIALAKARPGKIGYAGGIGTSMQTETELLKAMAGIDLLQVPYTGTAPAVIAALSGEAPVIMAPTLALLPHIRSGKLRALATTGGERLAAFPDLPTIAESGVPGFEASQWYGVLVPAGTPKRIVARLNTELVATLRSPEVSTRLTIESSVPVGDTPEEFMAFFKSEIVKWSAVLKFSGVRGQ